jgi:hypothetical protein
LVFGRNPDIYASYKAWSDGRAQFQTRKRNNLDSDASWERHYLIGTAPDGSKATTHTTKRKLAQFRRMDD